MRKYRRARRQSSHHNKKRKYKPQNAPGYLYIIQCEGTDCYKIGIAKNVTSRLKEMQTGCPYRLILINKWYVDRMLLREQVLHRHLSTQKTRGEWFILTPDIIENIEEIMEFHIKQWEKAKSLYGKLDKMVNFIRL
jgi:hypothetical protein